MRIKMLRGAGSRARSLSLLPRVELGWTARPRGIDVSVGFLRWYAYVEMWVRT
jgi:hypothetical protein